GTGYIFVLTNMLSVCLLVFITVLMIGPVNFGPSRPFFVGQTFCFGVLGFCYLAIYLGIGKLILSAASRVTNIRIVMRVMLHVLLIGLGTAIPISIQFSSADPRFTGYSLLQISNPFWTLIEMIRNRTL